MEKTHLENNNNKNNNNGEKLGQESKMIYFPNRKSEKITKMLKRV